MPACPPQKKWRAVEEHLMAEAPAAAPFRTALLRLAIHDETQVGAGAEGSGRGSGRMAGQSGLVLRLAIHDETQVIARAAGSGLGSRGRGSDSRAAAAGVR